MSNSQADLRKLRLVRRRMRNLMLSAIRAHPVAAAALAAGVLTAGIQIVRERRSKRPFRATVREFGKRAHREAVSIGNLAALVKSFGPVGGGQGVHDW